MKAYLIDPFTRTVTEVQRPEGEDMRRHLGPVDHVEAVAVAQVGFVVLTLYVDDGGVYRDPQAWFRIGPFPEPIPGKALCLGTGPQGETLPAPLSAADLLSGITWLGDERPQLTDASVTDRNGVTKRIPMNGPDAPKSAIEMALRVAEAEGDETFAAFIRKQMQP